MPDFYFILFLKRLDADEKLQYFQLPYIPCRMVSGNEIFRADLHKMKINTELCCKRYDFLTKKTQNYRYQTYCLDDNIQIYSYGLLCEHVLSMEDTSLLFLFISESVKVHFLPRVDSFSFAQEPHVVYCF
jgi:hypothetical protein